MNKAQYKAWNKAVKYISSSKAVNNTRTDSAKLCIKLCKNFE